MSAISAPAGLKGATAHCTDRHHRPKHLRHPPVSRIRRCSTSAGRKNSSLQERIFVPTISELVAKIRAFSSFRLTPAIDATSLMSSSSLDREANGKTRVQRVCVCGETFQLQPLVLPRLPHPCVTSHFEPPSPESSCCTRLKTHSNENALLGISDMLL